MSKSQLKFLSFWFQRIKKLIESDRGYYLTCCSVCTWSSDKSRRQQPITVITRPSLWAICKSMKCQTLFTEIIAEYWITNRCIYIHVYVHVRPLQNHNCINYILYTPTLNSLGLMKNCLDHVLKSQNLYMDWIFYIKRKKQCFGSLKYHSLLSLTGDCLTHLTIY